MKVFTIAWHEENIKNMKSSRDKKIEQMRNMQNDLERIVADIKKLELQIQRAKLENKEQFDPERYKIKTCGII